MTGTGLLAAMKTYEPELASIRHDLHRRPEIGYQEHRTAGIVAGCLRKCEYLKALRRFLPHYSAAGRTVEWTGCRL